MDFDDFDNGYENDPARSSPDYDLSNDQGGSETGIDPLNFRNPMNAYFYKNNKSCY